MSNKPYPASPGLQTAKTLHGQGRFIEAEKAYRQVLQQKPNDSGALQMFGVLLCQLGKVAEGTQSIERALKLDPSNAEIRFHLGIAYQMQGRLDQALAEFEQAIKARSDYLDAWNARGFVLHQLHRFSESIEALEHARKLSPNHVEVCFNLGNSLRDSGRMEDAGAMFRRAIQINGRHLGSLVNLGEILIQLGQSKDGIGMLQRARELAPNSGLVLGNLGTAYHQQGMLKEAESVLTKALGFEPSLGFARETLGNVYKDTKRADAALAEYAKAKTPGANLATVKMLHDEGRFADAVQAIDGLPSDPGLQVVRALLTPVILDSADDISAIRRGVADAFKSLVESGVQLEDPFRQVATTSFYLAYHGESDRAIQEQIGQFYSTACASLSSPAGSEVSGSGGDRIRVGIVSAFLHSHTIGKLFGPLIGQIDRTKFEVVLIRASAKTDEMGDAFAASADKLVQLTPNLAMAREAVAKERLDVLFYPDIGMDSFTNYLAYSRLAPVQCTTWGHPVTTGIPNMDYFISSTDLEQPSDVPADATGMRIYSHPEYTEKLVTLPDLTTYYLRPTKPRAPLSRAQMRLPEDAHLYSCPQTLFKLHPNFDATVAEILRRDPLGLFVLITGRHKHWDDLLMQRLQRNHPEVAARTRFVPQSDLDGYLSLLMASDAVLDTPYFGGGNSSTEAFAVGAPVVTLPGPLLRGRITLALYRKMGVLDLVARDEEHYVELAVRLANDKQWQAERRSSVEENCSVLFENAEAVRQLERFWLTSSLALAGEEV